MGDPMTASNQYCTCCFLRLQCAPCQPPLAAPHLPLLPQVLAGLVPLNKYVITKQLTKNPSDYPDAKNQPHVQVALRRRAQGKQNGVMAVSGEAGWAGRHCRGVGCWLLCRARDLAGWSMLKARAPACA